MSVRELVEKLVTAKKEEKIDWQERLKEWKDQVNKLYETVEAWLRQILDENLMEFIHIRREELSISEEFLGDYRIDKLIIDIAGEWLIFEPVGRHIIGSQGRVDFYRSGYKLDGYMLLLFLEEPDQPRWEVCKKTDKKDRSPIDKNAFERILEEMLRG